jgi:hypothetical protein
MILTSSRPRHRTLDKMERRLTAVTRGEAARTVRPERRRAAVVALPAVMWSEGPVGHVKAGGGLLPRPVFWGVPNVITVLPGESMTLTWRSAAWGDRAMGQITIACPTAATSGVGALSAGDLVTRVDGDVIPTEVEARPVPAQRVREVLDALVEEGDRAKWELHEEMSEWLHQSLRTAHRAVSAEMGTYQCVDDITLDDIHARLELGEDGKLGIIDKVINKLSGPQRPTGVDSIRYVVSTFRRDAELAIRRQIDDPRWVGPAFRRFAADHPGMDVAELVEEFNNSECLSERIGMERATRALRPAVQPTQVEVFEESLVSDSTDSTSEVRVLADAATRRYAHVGGVTGAARLAASQSGSSDEMIADLAASVASTRLLRSLAKMSEDDAAMWLARHLLGRSA